MKKKLVSEGDEPNRIMAHMSIPKLNKIVQSLREQNLFLIEAINEEEENIDR